MFTQVKLGHEQLVINSLGEKTKDIVFTDVFYFCEEKSVTRAEFYQAMQTGLQPSKVIKMNKYEYYHVMKSAMKRYAKVIDSITQEECDYTIVREYEVDSDSIELTLKRGLDNVNA